jgi:glucosylceramidase
MNRARNSITSLALVAGLLTACAPSTDTPTGQAGSGGPGSGGSAGAGTAGSSTGGSGPAGSGGAVGQAGSGGAGPAGTGGSATGVAGGGGAGPAGSGGAGPAGGGGTGPAGAGGGQGGSSGRGGSGGTGPAGAGGRGGAAGGTAGAAGAAATNVLVTSASGAYWQTRTWTETTTATATVTVNDTSVAQTWEGFGGSFNERGWMYLTSAAMQTQAINMLFGPDGTNFTWGRIPMGASDYADTRYTNDDTGTDVTPNSGGTNRPPADTSLAMFSIARDGQRLIPYIKAAQGVKPGIRFWASPWTPPVWMKTGWKTDNGSGGTVVRASYYDGGNMVNNAANLAAYAQLFTKFVQGYQGMGINIEVVSPQNEPGYDQNYPSCLWDGATYTAFIRDHLGPAMRAINVKVMLGTLSNAGDGGRNDITIATTVLADATARSFLSVAGVQWSVLERVNGGQTFMNLPIWATEHKCGNYPWNPGTGCGESSSPCPAYNMTMAPNDHAYGVESWIYLRNAITKGRVTSYSAWNMVLNRTGLGNDTSRDWRQNALLVAEGSTVTATPTYHVFRHLAQYVSPGAMVVGTTGGDAVAFKNTDGSIVAVVYNSGAANNNYVVAMGGKRFQFMMPSNGWATLKYKP